MVVERKFELVLIKLTNDVSLFNIISDNSVQWQKVPTHIYVLLGTYFRTYRINYVFLPPFSPPLPIQEITKAGNTN